MLSSSVLIWIMMKTDVFIAIWDDSYLLRLIRINDIESLCDCNTECHNQKIDVGKKPQGSTYAEVKIRYKCPAL